MRLVEVMAWMEKGACRNIKPGLFFPEREDNNDMVKTAKSVCQGCGVREECLNFALATNQTHGIWGGTDRRERARIKRARRKATKRDD